MGVYEDLLQRKKDGETISIDELTPELLKHLFIKEHIPDNMIAVLFDVKSSKITYLRRKHGITIRNSIIDDFLNKTPEEMEEKARVDLLKEENISKIAKALTHFAFRNGPVEDLHANPTKNLTDEDMKMLNKFMVNRLAYIFCKR